MTVKTGNTILWLSVMSRMKEKTWNLEVSFGGGLITFIDNTKISLFVSVCVRKEENITFQDQISNTLEHKRARWEKRRQNQSY